MVAALAAPTTLSGITVALARRGIRIPIWPPRARHGGPDPL